MFDAQTIDELRTFSDSALPETGTVNDPEGGTYDDATGTVTPATQSFAFRLSPLGGSPEERRIAERFEGQVMALLVTAVDAPIEPEHTVTLRGADWNIEGEFTTPSYAMARRFAVRKR